MKNFRSFWIVIFVLVLSVVLLTGCGAKSAIIGTWESDLGDLTFNSDGTMITSVFGIGTEGTYTFVDSDTVTISQFGVGSDYDVTIKNGYLYLKSNGITLTYSKAD